MSLATLAIVIRIGKMLGVVLFCSGAIGATLSRDYLDRQHFAYRLCGPAFFMIWGFGVGLTHFTGVSLFSVWIMGSALATLITLNAVLYVAGKEERASRGAAITALLPLLLAMVLMVWRP